MSFRGYETTLISQYQKCWLRTNKSENSVQAESWDKNKGIGNWQGNSNKSLIEAGNLVLQAKMEEKYEVTTTDYLQKDKCNLGITRWDISVRNGDFNFSV